MMLTSAGIDNTGATDSTAAVQAVITKNPRTVFTFPPGDYKISTLTITNGQILRGQTEPSLEIY